MLPDNPATTVEFELTLRPLKVLAPVSFTVELPEPDVFMTVSDEPVRLPLRFS